VHSYRTVSTPSTGTYREKGSKFLAFAYPVATEEEIRDRLDELKKKYFDARHHCYAWMLGADKNKFRAHDDGEPNHSAGDPILGQIRSQDITNVLIVVVRYFGGVKLGVGGLINAYRQAVAEALKDAKIVEREVVKEMAIEYDFSISADVLRLVKEFELHIMDQSFGHIGAMRVSVGVKNKQKLIERLNLMKALNKDVQFSEL
jgi:uncharacterized YigZ family protein